MNAGSLSSELWSWDTVGSCRLEETIVGDQSLNLLIISSPEGDDIGRIGLSADLSLDALAEQFRMYDTELVA